MSHHIESKELWIPETEQAAPKARKSRRAASRREKLKMGW